MEPTIELKAKKQKKPTSVKNAINIPVIREDSPDSGGKSPRQHQHQYCLAYYIKSAAAAAG